MFARDELVLARMDTRQLYGHEVYTVKCCPDPHTVVVEEFPEIVFSINNFRLVAPGVKYTAKYTVWRWMLRIRGKSA